MNADPAALGAWWVSGIALVFIMFSAARRRRLYRSCLLEPLVVVCLPPGRRRVCSHPPPLGPGHPILALCLPPPPRNGFEGAGLDHVAGPEGVRAVVGVWLGERSSLLGVLQGEYRA